ncbi:MAG: hypothetical protein ACXW1P_09240 [Methylophilaceae bacterium]
MTGFQKIQLNIWLVFIPLFVNANFAWPEEQDSACVSWQCFGVIELDSRSSDISDELNKIRFIRYKNGEFGVDLEKAGKTKKFLGFKNLQIYSGLSEDELYQKNQAINPFAFIDMSLVIPIMTLYSAYPSGIESVPEKTSKKIVQLKTDETPDISLETSHLSSNKIRYKMKILNWPNNPEFYGTWDGLVPDGLPDSSSLNGWQLKDKNISLKTIGDIRALNH